MTGPGEHHMLLSAVLIVRDEAAHITDCLATVRDLADEMVVYDTGSQDRTRELAALAGARVIKGHWDDDFARARNAAAAAAAGEWIVMVDGDHRVVADPSGLRALLASGPTVDAFTVRIDNVAGPDGGGAYANRASHLVRAGVVHYSGAVHERPVIADGTAPRTFPLPEDLLRFEHLGYRDAKTLRAKGIRNARIAAVHLDRLTASGRPDPEVVAGLLLDLGRSLVAAGRRQDAVDTFEALRELVPGTPAWLEGTDHLARLLLAAGHDEIVVVLADQLAEGGADRQWCDWLRAQALAQLGRPGEALELVRGIDRLIDPAGRRHDLTRLYEVRALLEAVPGTLANS